MIPVEVRKIIVASHENGVSVNEICHVTGASQSAVYSILKKYKERGEVEGNYPGRQPSVRTKK